MSSLSPSPCGGDGVPFSWDRKHSAELWTISFPGLSQKQHRDLRLTVTSLPHECVLRATQDDVLAILAWSFRVLASGSMPSARHDGSPWGPEDSWRKKHQGKQLLLGALIEVKGIDRGQGRLEDDVPSFCLCPLGLDRWTNPSAGDVVAASYL